MVNGKLFIVTTTCEVPVVAKTAEQAASLVQSEFAKLPICSIVGRNRLVVGKSRSRCIVDFPLGATEESDSAFDMTMPAALGVDMTTPLEVFCQEARALKSLYRHVEPILSSVFGGVSQLLYCDNTFTLEVGFSRDVEQSAMHNFFRTIFVPAARKLKLIRPVVVIFRDTRIDNRGQYSAVFDPQCPPVSADDVLEMSLALLEDLHECDREDDETHQRMHEAIDGLKKILVSLAEYANQEGDRNG